MKATTYSDRRKIEHVIVFLAELTAFIFPLYSCASSSIIGAIILQGPHHGAQKSTRTGTGDFKTISSQVVSLTGPAPAKMF